MASDAPNNLLIAALGGATRFLEGTSDCEDDGVQFAQFLGSNSDIDMSVQIERR